VTILIKMALLIKIRDNSTLTLYGEAQDTSEKLLRISPDECICGWEDDFGLNESNGKSYNYKTTCDEKISNDSVVARIKTNEEDVGTVIRTTNGIRKPRARTAMILSKEATVSAIKRPQTSINKTVSNTITEIPTPKLYTFDFDQRLKQNTHIQKPAEPSHNKYTSWDQKKMSGIIGHQKHMSRLENCTVLKPFGEDTISTPLQNLKGHKINYEKLLTSIPRILSFETSAVAAEAQNKIYKDSLVPEKYKPPKNPRYVHKKRGEHVGGKVGFHISKVTLSIE
jgi:hypothetical protein